MSQLSEPGSPQHTIQRSGMIIAVIVPLLGTIVAIILLWNRMVGWSDIAILLTMYVINTIGITVGFHRLLTHRSFETPPVIRFILLASGSLGLQGDPLFWASTHLQHHAHSDEDDDPHSPLHSLFHAHLGWLLAGFNPQIDTYGRWLQQDRMVMFFHRTYPLWIVLSFAIPFLLGGWTGLLWGGLVRIFLTHHVTWSVNSICHTFGQRDFDTRDQSRNQWLVGLLSMGEGWHNNHHAFPRSAFHGLRWWQIDVSAYFIMALERLGLARKVYRVSPEQFAARRRPAQRSVLPEATGTTE
jgi:stearoyl-CoA desaturase (delta-9 desaturase)